MKVADKERVLVQIEGFRADVMYYLFDLGRLIIESDEKRLKAFHDEIAKLTRSAYNKTKRDIDNGNDFEDSMIRNFGLDGHKNKCSSMRAGIHELLLFMYGEDSPKTNGFLMRFDGFINTLYKNKFK